MSRCRLLSRAVRRMGAGLSVAAAVILVAAAAGCGGERSGWTASRTSQEESRRYTDPAGWSLAYPSEMHLERSAAQLRISVSEVTIASFVPRTAVSSGSSSDGFWLRIDPPLDALGEFPSAAIAFRIVSQEGGPLPNLELPETRFPLRLASFGASNAYPNTEPRPGERVVVANGRTYVAYAWIGPSASSEFRAALDDVVSSLSFPHPRPGTIVGYGFTVLRPSSRYPVGSFMRVRAQGQPFVLVHAPGGFYAVGWRSEGPRGGYRSRCSLAVDERRKEFFCTNLSARWDGVGRVIVRPRSARRDDPLFLTVAKVAWDGHVLLHPGVQRLAGPSLARKLWPGWRRSR